MKTVFVYGILQKGLSSSEYGIEDKDFIGRARLNGYFRDALTAIYPGKDSDSVTGDICQVSDEIEQRLFEFESQFGYERKTTNPIRFKDKKCIECISYLLPTR